MTVAWINDLGDGVADTLALTGRRIRQLRRSPGQLLAITLTPVTMVIVLGYLLNNAITLPGGTGYLDFMMAGVGAQVALTCFGTSAFAMAEDLGSGIVDRFRSLPIGRIPVLLAQSIADLMLTVVGLVIASAVGWGLGWRIHAGFLSAAAAFGLLIALTFLLSWAGILVALKVRNLPTVNSLSGIVLVAGSFLSTAFVPPTSLPGWLRPIAEWSPISTVVAACRRLWGNPIADTGTSLAVTHPAPIALVTMTLLLVAAVLLSSRLYRPATV